jgi:hypothetical protein
MDLTAPPIRQASGCELYVGIIVEHLRLDGDAVKLKERTNTFFTCVFWASGTASVSPPHCWRLPAFGAMPVISARCALVGDRCLSASYA